MFFSQLLLLIKLSAMYAMTTQETEQRDQKPLLLPLLGNPEALLLKRWYWVGNNHRSIKSKFYGIALSFQYNEIRKCSYTRNVVFGTWDYVNAGAESPSSALTISKDRNQQNFAAYDESPFSIRQPNGKDTFLQRLLHQFDNKMISFWWDSTTPLWIENEQENTIAELAIGGMNPSRFVAGTEMSVQLRFPTTRPWYWDLQTGTTVYIGKKNMNWNKIIQLGLEIESSIPMVIYDAITKHLRDEMRYTVGFMKGMPQDTNMRIMQYLDLNEHISRFDCKDAKKLLPLHIGELTIPPSMMYKRISPDKCQITLRKNDNQADQDVLTIGIDLIRLFYMSLVYDNWNAPIVQFATRVEGNPPPPPTGPPCERSQLPACITRTPSAKCCVIS